MHGCAGNGDILLQGRYQIGIELIVNTFLLNKWQATITDAEHGHEFVPVRRALLFHQSPQDFGLLACADDLM